MPFCCQRGVAHAAGNAAVIRGADHYPAKSRAEWPSGDAIRAKAGGIAEEEVYEVASEVLGEIRRFKSDSNLSLGAPVGKVVVRDTAERIAILERSLLDVKDAGRVGEFATVADGGFSVSVTPDGAA